ncbi:MAG: sigma-54 dependent transcriptional regulator [Bacteroidetes bacterium]|jgi:DNA-binding NtrC family response regulator|nr:sigma-54 dependent transcriptional regulator [Bacteroidota bacterium]
MNVLIIEDEKISRISLTNTIRKEGFDAASAASAEEGLEVFERERPAVVVTDLRLPKADGLHVLSTVLAKAPETKVVIITAHATVETAVAALRMGAYDYLTKPFSPERLLTILRNLRRLIDVVGENEALRTKIQLLEDRPLVGISPVVRQLVERIAHIGPSDSTILVEGESGTGKEVVARAVHRAGPRRSQPFVVVSSAGFPESLLESELFGHERGSFTGALRRHVGYFERAHRGTLFIDDIDDLPLTMQTKLLRVLQEREITRVGGTENIPVDVRVIAATKADLRGLVAVRKFREDLFYRLNILPIRLPPLRERKEDIPGLIAHFLAKHQVGGSSRTIGDEVLERCLRYDWPGNVRELENFVERWLALPAGTVRDPSAWEAERPAEPSPLGLGDADVPAFDDYIMRREQEIIGWALKKSGQNVSEAARLLKLPRTTLVSKLPKLFPGEDVGKNGAA